MTEREATPSKPPSAPEGRPATSEADPQLDLELRYRTAQAELNRTQAKYRALVEQIPAIVYIDVADEDMTTTYVSPQIQQILGYSAQEYIHDPQLWERILHPDDRDQAKATYLRGRAAGGSFVFEYRLVARDGRTVWFRDSAIVLPDEHGNPEFIQGVMLDITERKLAEESLRESERRFRELLETVHLVAVITEVDGTITFCNDYLCRLSGYPMNEIIGRNWIDLFVPPEVQLPEAEFYEALVRGEVRSFMTGTLRTRDGDVRAVSWSNTALRAPDGRILSAASIGEDITDRVRAERALRESEERRRAVLADMVLTAEEERRTIAIELHDDTVQVMASVLMTIDRLVRAAETEGADRTAARAREARAVLAEATERTRRLMFELRPQLLESGGLKPAVTALVEHAGREAGFVSDVTIEVGRYDEAAEQLIYRTVLELVTNVRKHARATSVIVELRERDGLIRGKVQDDGAGFDPERRRRRALLNIGLDTAEERIRLAGGEAWVDSEPGAGTRVEFVLPAEPRGRLRAAGRAAAG